MLETWCWSGGRMVKGRRPPRGRDQLVRGFTDGSVDEGRRGGKAV